MCYKGRETFDGFTAVSRLQHFGWLLGGYEMVGFARNWCEIYIYMYIYIDYACKKQCVF